MQKYIRHFPVIETERLMLRRITLKDRYDIKEIYSNEEVMKYYGIFTIKDIDIIENLIIDYDEGYVNNTFYRWGIELKKNNKLIGTCGVHNWVKKFAKCEIGYELNDSYWNQGYMTEALNGIIEYSFLNMGINRIEAQTYPENEASYKLLENIGFKREGLLRECAYFRNKFQDLFMYSLLRSDIY